MRWGGDIRDSGDSGDFGDGRGFGGTAVQRLKAKKPKLLGRRDRLMIQSGREAEKRRTL